MSFNPLLRLSEQRVTEKQPEIMSYVFLFQLTKTLSSKIIKKKKKSLMRQHSYYHITFSLSREEALFNFFHKLKNIASKRNNFSENAHATLFDKRF